MIKLGSTYTDIITGFKGVATGYVQYITGCNQALLAPQSSNGDFKESTWIDEIRLEVDTNFSPIELKKDEGSVGFDKPAPRI